MTARALVLAGCLLTTSCGDGGVLRPPVAADPGGSLAMAMCRLGYSAASMRRLPTGHQVADVVLNGRPAVFVVDSGANVTVLDARRADAYDLKPDPLVRGFALGLGGGMQARAWRVGDLAIDGAPTRLKRIMTADLGPMIKVLSPGSAKPVDGIIGQDILRTHRAVIDVAGARLYLAEAGEPVPCAAPRA